MATLGESSGLLLGPPLASTWPGASHRVHSPAKSRPAVTQVRSQLERDSGRTFPDRTVAHRPTPITTQLALGPSSLGGVSLVSDRQSCPAPLSPAHVAAWIEMQNSSLFHRGTDFLLLFPFALSPPLLGKKQRHPRPRASTGWATEAVRKVSFWERGTGARLLCCSEQWNQPLGR